MKKILLGITLAAVIPATKATTFTWVDTDTMDVRLGATGQNVLLHVAQIFNPTTGANKDFNIAVDDGDGDNGYLIDYVPQLSFVPYVLGSGLTDAFVGFSFTTEGNAFSTYKVKFRLDDPTFTDNGLGYKPATGGGTTFSLGGTVLGINFADLQATGKLDYEVRWISGPNLRLTSASLIADRITVPEGVSTLGLLGSSLFGLGLLARRFARSNSPISMR
jgi:hypothetical protein